MTYIVVQFDYANRKGMYEKLLRVFEESVRVYDPENDVIVKEVKPPQVKTKHCFSSNTLKIAIWVEEMKKLPEGHEICFIDCDMMVIKNPNDVFDLDFDIAYTKRPKPAGHRLPVNGGVVFCRNTEKSRSFMMKWKEINDKMYNDRKFHERYRKKYAGMNQSAFGYLMEHPQEWDAHLVPVECNTYNVCNESWHRVGHDPNIRIVHVKSQLRKMVLSGVCSKRGCEEAVRMWLELYNSINGDQIVMKIDPVRPLNRRMKKRPIPTSPKKKKNVHKLEMEATENEAVCLASGRKSKRRLYVP